MIFSYRNYYLIKKVSEGGRISQCVQAFLSPESPPERQGSLQPAAIAFADPYLGSMIGSGNASHHLIFNVFSLMHLYDLKLPLIELGDYDSGYHSKSRFW